MKIKKSLINPSYLLRLLQTVVCLRLFLTSISRILTTLLLFAITTSLCLGAEQQADKVAIQLKWKHAFQFAGFYAALEKGFYDEAGLDVSIIEGGPGIDFIDAVLSGKAQYGLEMPTLLLRRAKGGPVVVLASIFQYTPISLMSLAEKNIRTPQDLIGRNVMMRRDTALRAMISKSGVDLAAINIIPHSFDLEDLIQGKTDAMSLYITDTPAEFERRGIAFNSMIPQDYGVKFYGDSLFTTEDQITKHPGQVEAFRKASLKGWEYAMKHPEEIARLIHEKYRPNRSIEVLLSEAEQMKALLLHEVVEIGHINPQRWKQIRDSFVDQGMLSADFSLEGFIYEPAVIDKRFVLTDKEDVWLRANPELGKLALKIRSRVSLSESERSWIASTLKVPVRVGDSPPFYFTDNDEPQGLAIDYVKIMCIAFDLDCNYVSGMQITESFTSMREPGGIAVQPGWQRNPDREEFSLFTRPHIFSPYFIFQRKGDTPIKGIEGLKGKRVVVGKNFAIHKLLKENYPDLQLIGVDFTPDAMELLSAGKADAFVSSLLVGTYSSLKAGLPNIVAVARTPFAPNTLSIAVRKDWPELASIMDKGLAALAPSEHSFIKQRWTLGLEESFSKQTLRVSLTSEERTWLKKHPVIHLGNSVDWPPFGFINNDGVYSGIAADYFKTIEKLLNIKIEPAKMNSWKETVDAARAGKVDLLDAVVPTPQRREFLSFTKPYLSFPVVIFTHKDIPYIGNMSELDGQRVAVIMGSALHDILVNNHSDFEILPIENAREGVLEVEKGNAIAFIGNLSTASRVISTEGITNLKVAGETPYRYNLTIGVNKNKPILASILQKALDAIPQNKKEAIYNDWFSIKYQHEFDYQLLWKVIAVFITMMILLLAWNRYIQRQRNKLQLAQRAAEKAAKQAHIERDKAQLYLDLAGSIIVGLDHEGKVLIINPKGCEVLGADCEDIVGRHWFNNFIPDSDRELTYQVYQQIMAGEVESTEFFENTIVTINEQERLVAWHNALMFDDDKNIIGTLSAGEDITERRKAEKDLKTAIEKEKQFSSLVELATSIAEIGIWDWDLNTDLTTWNQRAFEIHGMSQKEGSIPYDEWAKTVHPDDLEKVQASTQKAINEKKQTFVEFRIYRKDGKLRYLYTGSAPVLNNRNEVVRLVGTNIDITERKLTEINLKEAKEEADRANRVKSNFLANMSHELRTPLNAVLGYAQVLLNDQTLTGKQRKGLTVISEGGQHLVTLIEDILSFSKMESKKIELSLSSVLLRPFLNSIVNIIKPKAKSNVNIVCNIEEVIPEAVEIDDKRLRQVLLNLLSNAVKFTSEGHVVLNVELCDSVNVDKKHTCLHFSIKDTGSGIKQEYLKEIFLPFGQVAVSESEQSREGTGLGLSISQQLVKFMGGEINVESIPGKGSCFWFELMLPVVNEVVATSENLFMQPVGYKGEQKHLLIVDDVQTNRNLLCDILTDKGFMISAVSSAAEAIALVDNEIPDMVLTDLIMPVMNGFELKLVLSEIPKMKDIPIVAISANISDEEKTLQAGFDDFISKPVNQEQLFHVIKNKLDLVWEETISEEVSKDQSLTAPPADELESLRQLVMQGRVRHISSWANEIKLHHPECIDFVGCVQTLAEQLDEGGILALIDDYFNQ